MVNAQLPNGPQTHPWLQTLEWMKDPLGFMDKYTQKYGDMFTVTVGPVFKPQVFISDSQAIQQILTTDPQQLDSGLEAGVTSPLLGSHSLLCLAGKPHQRQRKLLIPPFHGERMRNYSQVIIEITNKVTQHWYSGESFTLLPTMQAISFEVILKTVFGLKSGERYDKIKELLLEIMNPKNPLTQTLAFLFPALQRDLGSWSPWGHFLELKKQLDQAVYVEIAERRENFDATRTDILSMMLLALDEAGQPMSDEEIRDELITLLVAGHETTATSLAWALYWIHRFPEIKEKLLQELGTLEDVTDATGVMKLPYLNAVCQETLRIYPVAMLMLSRLVKSPLKIGGYEFQPGTLLVPSIYSIHHREDLYPNPKQFNPERFLDRQYAAHEYIPFGGGNRRCIGMAFAWFEMKLVLATLLSQWKLELTTEEFPKPERRRALLGMSESVKLLVKGKRSPSELLSENSNSVAAGS